MTLYPLVNLVPFTGNTSTSQLLWRASSYPQFTLQFPTRVLDTHKVLVHRKSKHKSPRAALWQVLIGSGAVYSFAQSTNQLQALYLLYLGFQPLTVTSIPIPKYNDIEKRPTIFNNCTKDLWRQGARTKGLPQYETYTKCNRVLAQAKIYQSQQEELQFLLRLVFSIT